MIDDNELYISCLKYYIEHGINLFLTHNNKNALSKDNFVGRTYVSLRDLHDYDHFH